MSSEQQMPSRDAATTPRTVMWSQAFYYHFLFFIHWILPSKDFNNLDKQALRSPKVQFLAFLNIILTSWIIALGFLGITEGPMVLAEFIAFNWLVYSQMLLNYAIYTFLFYYVLIIGLGFIIPFLFNTLVNIKALRTKELAMQQIFLTSSYGMLSLFFLIPLVYAIALLASGSNPQIVEIEMNDWQTPIWYVLAGIILLGCVFSANLNKKAWIGAAKSQIHAGLGLLITFLLTATVVSLFFMD